MSRFKEDRQRLLGLRRAEAVEEFWMDLHSGGLKLLRYTIFAIAIAGLLIAGVHIVGWLA